MGLSWFLPLIFVSVDIVFFSTEKIDFDECYIYMKILMYNTIARIIIIVDIVLLCCYCAIIYIIYKRDRKVKGKHLNQAKSINSFILCVGIVCVFIVTTTPFVAIHVTIWKKTEWLESLSKFVLSLNQICNSLVYFAQKYLKSKRPVRALRRNSQGNIESNNTRL